MAEELVEVMERFTLTSRETKEPEIVLDDMSQCIKECKRSLIGKLIGDRIANFNGVKRFAESAWGNPRKLKIAKIGQNLFQFNFEQDTDKERVISGGPWIYDNQLLIMKQWYERIEDDQPFKNEAFWVQV